MKQVTCNVCGQVFNESETMPMPEGYVCDTDYAWMERMMEEAIANGN